MRHLEFWGLLGFGLNNDRLCVGGLKLVALALGVGFCWWDVLVGIDVKNTITDCDYVLNLTGYVVNREY